MKKKIKITPLEIALIIIEAIFLLALIVSTRAYFKGNIQNIIASIVLILISTYLTIVNRKKLFMPYFLTSSNALLAGFLSAGFNNNNGYESSIFKFRMIAFVATAILLGVNSELYEKIILNE